MTLRAWQAEAVPIALRHLRGEGSGVVRAVMGAGKSIAMAHVVRELRGRVLVTAPTIRLVEQLTATLRGHVGEPVGQCYTHAHQIERITVCCHPSLDRLPWDWSPDVWIADECHQTEAPDVRVWAALGAPSRSLGWTATPWGSVRGRGLSLWDDLLYDYTARQALADGVVVPWRIVHPRTEGDADDVCLDMIQRTAGPGVVNATTINDAEHYATWLTEHGVPSAAVHSRVKDGGADALERLREGDLRCLVHVNMLSEGVDLPWLQWLCLRRPGSNPVRFAQEVGRALRAYPGKTHADILDPHDLFGLFRLDEEAVLGGAVADKPDAAALPPDMHAQELRLQIEQWSPQVIPVEGVPAIRSYLRRLVSALDAAGLAKAQVSSRSWRGKPATAKQVAFIRDHRFSRAPARHAAALCRIAARADQITRGDCSDLITIRLGIRKGWPEKQLALYDDT